MERTAVFTISRGVKGYDIKSKTFNTYNRYNVAKNELFTAMEEITDIFNNVLGIAVMFDIE